MRILQLLGHGGVGGTETFVISLVRGLGERGHDVTLANTWTESPLNAAADAAGIPFVGLPGNPAAAMVTFLRFARPLILRLAGANQVAPLIFRVRADFDHKKKLDRREWVRARLKTGDDGNLAAVKFSREGAGILSSMVESHGLVELPEEMTQLTRGTMVDFLPFSEVGA